MRQATSSKTDYIKIEPLHWYFKKVLNIENKNHNDKKTPERTQATEMFLSKGTRSCERMFYHFSNTLHEHPLIAHFEEVFFSVRICTIKIPVEESIFSSIYHIQNKSIETQSRTDFATIAFYKDTYKGLCFKLN